MRYSVELWTLRIFFSELTPAGYIQVHEETVCLMTVNVCELIFVQNIDHCVPVFANFRFP